MNFKVENGYFLCLYFMVNEALMTVKSMSAVDLRWDIWEASENKKEPVSLRGTGVYSLSGQIISSCDLSTTEFSVYLWCVIALQPNKCGTIMLHNI